MREPGDGFSFCVQISKKLHIRSVTKILMEGENRWLHDLLFTQT